jgi:hypothetical protein
VSYKILIKSNLTDQQKIDAYIQNRLLNGEKPIEIYESEKILFFIHFMEDPKLEDILLI